MTTREFFAMIQGMTPVQILASRLRIVGSGANGLAACADSLAMRSGVATPDGGGATDSGEAGGSAAVKRTTLSDLMELAQVALWLYVMMWILILLEP